jgi:eukaryotic-like serine/threonine-protein kinase
MRQSSFEPEACTFKARDVLHFIMHRDPRVFSEKSFAGRYEISEVLSVTHSNLLLLARRKVLGGLCVIKVLLEDQPESKSVYRFYREVKSLMQLRHSAVVQLEDAGIEDGIPYYVMEYLKGPNLYDYLACNGEQGGAQPSAEWLRQTFTIIADALLHCHERGVVHRDVKPENIIIASDHDLPVLVDFGLVKHNASVDGESLNFLKGQLTNDGEMLGTPAYQSPEQVDPGGDFGIVTAATDSWGFGSTLFYCLAGQTPYGEKTVLEAYVALLSSEPRQLDELRAEVPEDLALLCRRCLNKNSAARPSMLEIRNSLRRVPERPYIRGFTLAAVLATTLSVLFLILSIYSLSILK